MKKPAAKKRTAKKTVARKPTAKKPSAKRVVARKPAAKKKSSAKRPAVKKPAAKRPAVKKSAAKRPAVKKKSAAKRSAVKKSVASVRTLKQLPVTWWITTGSQTVGLWVDDFVWTGNHRGEVRCLRRDDGELVRGVALPDECVAVISDEAWKYAGCNDGNVYDITGDQARVAYTLGGARVDWMEIYRGTLCVSDHAGTVTVLSVDGTQEWRKADAKASDGWVLRVADDGLYHGSLAGLRKYQWDGTLVWSRTPGDVRYGHIEGDAILVTAGYAVTGGVTSVVLMDRATGRERWRHAVSSAGRAFHPDGAEACGAGRTAAGELRYYASIGGWVFCFDADGALRWRAPTRCDGLCNLHVVGESLYFASNNGTIGCVDVSDVAIARVIDGAYEAPTKRRQRQLAARSSALESTADASGGVVVECVDVGGHLRIHVVSPGYHREWFCQFPKDIREAGARYVVDEVREATQGGFYRARGNIRRLTT